MSNINIAVFESGSYQSKDVTSLKQWGYGQTLRIQGLDLPEAVERGMNS